MLVYYARLLCSSTMLVYYAHLLDIRRMVIKCISHCTFSSYHILSSPANSCRIQLNTSYIFTNFTSLTYFFISTPFLLFFPYLLLLYSFTLSPSFSLPHSLSLPLSVSLSLSLSLSRSLTLLFSVFFYFLILFSTFSYVHANPNIYSRGKRKLQLEHIKEELRYPWLDLRKSICPPSENEMFTIITGSYTALFFIFFYFH